MHDGVSGQQAEQYAGNKAKYVPGDRALVVWWTLIYAAGAGLLAALIFVVRWWQSYLYWWIPLVHGLMGVGQWLLLRRRLAVSGWWIAASLIPILASIPQWLILRNKVHSAGWWVPGNLLALTINFLFYELLSSIFVRYNMYSMYLGRALDTVLFLAALGAVYGLTTSLVLRALLKHRSDTSS